MPTVSNHDVLGPMTWGAGGNTRQRYFPQDALDRSDARGGINSLLFGEASAAGPLPGPCAGYATVAPSEHAYAAGGMGACPPPPQRSSFVSENGYYGYHQRHLGHGAGPAVADDAGLGQDCSMDTSENNPPACGFAFGERPSGAGAGAFGFGQQRADADPARTQAATRKRHFEARATAAPAEDAAERAFKRTRPSPCGEAGVLPGASSQAMAQAFGVHTSAPGIAEQSHFQAQTYDLPVQLLPGSTSQLADAMTPRPRCLMGHFI